MAVERFSPEARVFKTAWFARTSKKAHIREEELCSAIRQVMLGQADDLGGGVFKKRLNKNMHRSIVLARGGRCWIYVFVFAKQDRANISDEELTASRSLAASYARMSDKVIASAVDSKELVEICNGDQQI
jgi:hypothetical protein